MELLLNHWHCILPVIGIGAALFFMRDKSKDKKDGHSAAVAPQDDID